MVNKTDKKQKTSLSFNPPMNGFSRSSITCMNGFSCSSITSDYDLKMVKQDEEANRGAGHQAKQIDAPALHDQQLSPYSAIPHYK